jgi:flagellar basal-body rod protein FlgF
MENTVLAVISQQMSARRQMDVIANNIANANTVAFKSERMIFSEYLQDIGNGQTIAFVNEAGVGRDFSDGPISSTSNPLDIAIRGDGYLIVETSDGVAYTRNGRLRIDADGALVTSNGHAVLSSDEYPILFVPGDTQIVIDEDGRITAESGEIGTLALYTFADMSKVEKLGEGLFVTDEIPEDAPEDTTIIQGALEGSNVVPVVEMTRMISILRSYESAQKLSDQEHDLRRRAISTLGSVSESG